MPRRHRSVMLSLLLSALVAVGLVAVAPTAAAAAPAAASTAADHLAVTGASMAGLVRSSAVSAAGWTSVSAVRQDGLLTIVGRRSSGSALLFRSKSTGSFTATANLGGPIAGGVAVVVDSGRTDVVAIDGAHRLQIRTWRSGQWSGWKVLGSGRYLGAPAAVRTGADELRIVAVGTDRKVYQLVRRDSGGLTRRLLGGSYVSGTPAITYRATGRQIFVFWTTTGGNLYRKAYTSGVWHAAGIIGTGFSPGGVASVRPTSGSHWVVALRPNHHVSVMTNTASTGWSKPVDLGGSVTGSPAITWDPSRSRIDVLAVGTNGTLYRRARTSGNWANWAVAQPGTGSPLLSPAKVLVARWGGSLTGLPGVISDLRTAAAGGTIVSPCGSRVRLDPRLLNLLVATTDRYHVMINNLVTGHSCDSGRHPRGAAVDFNIVTDPRTGARTNLHSGGSGDNATLDRQFVSFLATKLPAGGGLGQRYCGSRGSAAVPKTILFFSDTCNHQHAQVAAS